MKKKTKKIQGDWMVRMWDSEYPHELPVQLVKASNEEAIWIGETGRPLTYKKACEMLSKALAIRATNPTPKSVSFAIVPWRVERA